MDLQQIVNNLLEDSLRTPRRGLSAIAEAEKYLQQAYEGRYFFELIQNVRDANKEMGHDGEVHIELKNNVLSIANSGAEFSARGIEGITTIGKSTKQSQDFIGFKGIGFKSIQDVSEKPSIVTRYGTVCFDKGLTIEQFPDTELDIEEIPLFYFPHYDGERLQALENAQGFVTKIVLPLKNTVTEDKIVRDISEIQTKQLILLGNIHRLRFISDKHSILIEVHKLHHKRTIEVIENGLKTTRFKYFSPQQSVKLPGDVLQQLPKKEKELFKNNAAVEISIVLELSPNGQITPVDDAKLYLFYPLEIASGFRFIIHSYFIVNPERKSLRENAFNAFLLKAIGWFIAHEFLQALKRDKANTSKILCFNRNKDAKLDALYDAVVSELKTQRFIYDTKTQKYFLPSEVMVADGFDKGLFPDGIFAGKRLIYADDPAIVEWLRNEFGVGYLQYHDIANQIELECRRQLQRKNIRFFQNLYNYVSQHEQLNLTGKRVLLTEEWKLVSSDEDVFYGGGKKNPVNLPASIRKHIHFINKGVKISDFREGRSRTGIVEFSSYELVRRLLKLFANDAVPNQDVLNAIYDLQPLDAKAELEVKEKIRLPVKGTTKWLSPITNPIYFETPELLELYPNGNFVDEGILRQTVPTDISVLRRDFLSRFGVWSIPAVYLSTNRTRVLQQENRDKLIGNFSGLVSKPYYVQNDRILDKPVHYNSWFTYSVQNNWGRYANFISSKLLPPVQVLSQQSTNPRNLDEKTSFSITSFTELLLMEPWIVFSGETEGHFVRNVVGVSPLEFSQPHNYVIRKYLKLLPMTYEANRGLASVLGLLHLDAPSIHNYKELLRNVYRSFRDAVPQGQDFADFYNRLLGKFVDFFFASTQMPDISQFGPELFLAVNDVTKQLSWQKAANIFYIDDKPGYDLLPLSIKHKIQPQFTNRDKNAFGRIAARIGKRFSKSVQRVLLNANFSKASPLIVYFRYLPEAVALLETRLETIAPKAFLDGLKAVRVCEEQNLQVRITLADADSIVLSASHFVSGKDSYTIHLAAADLLNRNRQLADAVGELFIFLLGRDLRQFNSDLYRFLNAADKPHFLNEYEVSDERVHEIKNKLHSSDYTVEQRFWQALLATKGLGSQPHLFEGKDVDATQIAHVLGVDDTLALKFQIDFNFNQSSNPHNIEPLVNLLASVSLTLSEINTLLFPKIDFRPVYEKQLVFMHNNFEKTFEALLHKHLTKQSQAERARYQDYLDLYRNNGRFMVPVDVLSFNNTEFFVGMLSKHFSFLKISKLDLDRSCNGFNPVSIYAANLDALKKALVSLAFADDLLANFLADNKIRSLLYFDEVPAVAESFKIVLLEHSNQKRQTDEGLQDFLREFVGGPLPNIEKASTSSVAVHTSGGTRSAPATGRRYDGSAGEQRKMEIGLVAEMVVFDKLNSVYVRVKWVSKYASKIYKSHAGYNPEGQDGLGYDIEYFDGDGNKFFVEVKGKADTFEAFEISKTELERAYREKEFYKVFFVTQTMNKEQRRIRDLGNLFLLENGQDFFANTKFKALYRNFDIRFHQLH